MKSHADTLRHMAEEKFIIRREAYDHPDRAALLAGAAAIDTLTKVREVMALIAREWPEMDHTTIQEYNPWCPEHGHLTQEKK